MNQKVLPRAEESYLKGLVLLAGPEAAEGVNIITFFAPWFPGDVQDTPGGQVVFG